ncbi:hypothetical protein JCGZ_11269 [Jatropha curcas]|uniref:Uncharacterized protein n=1 Tax=Jatropha curcas TaxID=180498 RepID=A0A067KIE4_JATCU|nr:hypothetical protein JCGZ_11269 [Jatropha curcas]
MGRYNVASNQWVLLSIDDYNEVYQLYEAARLKLVEARLSDEHISIGINTIKKKTCNAYAMHACNAITNFHEFMQRVDMVPPAGRGRGMRRGGHAGREARCQPVIVKETEDSGSEDLKEMALNMS